MISTNRFTSDILCDFLRVLQVDTIDFVTGSLLDNTLHVFRKSTGVPIFGYIAVYESFLSCDRSEYYVEIADTPEDVEKLLGRWYKFKEKQEDK